MIATTIPFILAFFSSLTSRNTVYRVVAMAARNEYFFRFGNVPFSRKRSFSQYISWMFAEDKMDDLYARAYVKK